MYVAKHNAREFNIVNFKNRNIMDLREMTHKDPTLLSKWGGLNHRANKRLDNNSTKKTFHFLGVELIPQVIPSLSQLVSPVHGQCMAYMEC